MTDFRSEHREVYTELANSILDLSHLAIREQKTGLARDLQALVTVIAATAITPASSTLSDGATGSNRPR
jgi:hypothetical protein